MKTLILLFLASTAWATPNWHRVQPDGSLACSIAYAAQEVCGPGCVAREHDQDCEVLVMGDVTETYQEENPVWRAQLDQLERDGHLDDGSTVTTAPPMLTKTRVVKKLMEDAAKRAAKDARKAKDAADAAAKAQARDARKARLESSDASSANSVTALRAIVKDLVDEAKDK